MCNIEGAWREAGYDDLTEDQIWDLWAINVYPATDNAKLIVTAYLCGYDSGANSREVEGQ